MHLVKKTINFTGNVIGTFFEYKIKFLGYTIGTIAKLSNKENVYIKSKNISNKVGKSVSNSIKITSNIMGTVADESINLSFKIVKYIGKKAIKTKITMYGNSENFYKGKDFINATYNIKK